jgi:hypothetical protein
LNEGNWFGLPLVIGGCLAARDRVNER